MKQGTFELSWRYAVGVYSTPIGAEPGGAKTRVTSADISALSSTSTIDSDAILVDEALYLSVIVSFSGTVASGGSLSAWGSNERDTALGQVPGEYGQPSRWVPIGASVAVPGAAPLVAFVADSPIPYRWIKIRFTSGGGNTGSIAGDGMLKAAA